MAIKKCVAVELLWLLLVPDVLSLGDDGYRLLDGHYVGRVGCDRRGDMRLEMQPLGNLTLKGCKQKCDAQPSCRGLSFQRGGMHPRFKPATTCVLKRRCSGRVVTIKVCEPDGMAQSTMAPDCIARRSNTFNYMRVIPLATAGSEGTKEEEAVSPATTRPGWDVAFARLASNAQKVGLLYLNLGDTWPPWTRFIVRAAIANHDVAFYFLGAPLDVSMCPNCASLPFDLSSLRNRIRLHILNVSEVDMFGAKGNAARKLCDLVPMWPALFPELSARHKFIGITEHDMLPGALSSEFARLRDEDDMMIPLERFPQPLTDANFMVFRSIPKMLHAYRRVPGWEQVITSPSHFRFDEWVVEPPSIMVAFQEMLLASEVRVLPAQKFLVQDTVIIRKRRYPRIDDYGARVLFRWRRGLLTVERNGSCICPKDVVPTHGITWCLECFHNPGIVLQKQTHRRLEVIGFHFSAWKKNWRRAAGGDPAQQSSMAAVPTCSPTADFDVGPSGFACAN